MNEVEKKKLQSIIRKLGALRKEVEELLGEEVHKAPKSQEISVEAKNIIDSINELSVNALEVQLTSLGHKDLGDVYASIGGSGGDKRKPKAWLIERIMWLSKEFSEGHRSIRES